jgi:mRNA interferase RelE/StbE
VVRTVRYTPDALKALKRLGNMAARMMKSIKDYAENPDAHANNVRKLKGSSAMRLRVGAYRVIFEQAAAEVIVTDMGLRGGIYE